ncbi:hypothetical protein PHYBOEH_003541 [Phytophthora boehmeriae]|uniref:Ankyrin repeat-containing domain n=1 Tax=Phytophthora boehmeriae TaxID=109152 RepID=A0A8T1X7X1_9STRA|nr:hypothetical protein PHYBOEH_003541 [Phytophthora boehmeriae]
MKSNMPILSSVQVVASHYLPDGGVPHILHVINDFLDDFSVDCTIVDGYKRTHSLRFVQYIAAREDPQEMNVFYRRWLFNATAEQAAAQGDVMALQWLMENYFPQEFTTKAVLAAAANGHLQVLKWLYEEHYDRGYWGYIELRDALLNGHTEVVKWLREHVVPRKECMDEVVNAAAAAGSLEIVKWLRNEHKATFLGTLTTAMHNSQWEVAN